MKDFLTLTVFCKVSATLTIFMAIESNRATKLLEEFAATDSILHFEEHHEVVTTNVTEEIELG